MARVNYGDGVANQTGSLNRKFGGVTFQKNGRKRIRVVGQNPQTAKQIGQRALFAETTKGWGNLTELQRQGYETAAKSGEWTFPDGFTGVPRRPTSGKELFQSLSLNASTATGAYSGITEPRKAVRGSALLGEVTAEAEAGALTTLSLEYSGALTADEVLVVYTTPVLTEGTMNVRKSALRKTYVGNAASPFGIDDEYGETHPGQYAVPGLKIGIMVQVLNQNSGESYFIGSQLVIIAAG